MDKNSILTMVLMAGLAVLLMFGFKTCNQEKSDNNGDLNFAETVIDPIELRSVSNNVKQKIEGETSKVKFIFNTEGAALESYQIIPQKQLKNGKSENVELILLSDDDEKPFSHYWGNDRQNPVRDAYQFEDASNEEEIKYIFSCDYIDNSGKPFTLNKIFTLPIESYTFKISMNFITKNNRIPDLAQKSIGYSYSLYYGPQIGPQYGKLAKKAGGRSYGETRGFYENYEDSKGKIQYKPVYRSDLVRKSKKSNTGLRFYRETMEEKNINWVALAGKYFVMIADIPSDVDDLFYESDNFTSEEEGFLTEYKSEFFMSVATMERLDQTKIDYFFYMGPRDKEIIKIEQETFGRQDRDYSKVNHTHMPGFGPLILLIKNILSFFNYGINGTGLGNWGLSIVIFTIILKVLLFGLTRKSYESTSKMQSISPKINELKAELKDKPQEMNAAMADLYKKEGVNPMMGCLPMLLQFPILISIYFFINTSYELRGQSFLWIADLSLEDATIPFVGTVPLLNWTSLNILPVLYIATQMLSTWIMQPSKKDKDHKKTAATGQQLQMKFMQYGLPLVFFFLLYAAPSGLFVYWITMNLVTTLQQFLYNKFYKGKNKKGKKGGGLMNRLQKMITTKKA